MAPGYAFFEVMMNKRVSKDTKGNDAASWPTIMTFGMHGLCETTAPRECSELEG